MKKPLPTFENEDEERTFWENHDATDYADFKDAKRTKFPNLKPSSGPTTTEPARAAHTGIEQPTSPGSGSDGVKYTAAPKDVAKALATAKPVKDFLPKASILRKAVEEKNKKPWASQSEEYQKGYRQGFSDGQDSLLDNGQIPLVTESDVAAYAERLYVELIKHLEATESLGKASMERSNAFAEMRANIAAVFGKRQ